MAKNYRYTIDDANNFTVELFEDKETIPFVRQPFDQQQNPWESHEQAKAWAVETIKNMQTPPTAPSE